jgi:hypothetical protein
MLALEQPAPTAFLDKIPTMSLALSRILTELHDCPMIISDRRCNIVGWNQAAAAIFLVFSMIPPQQFFNYRQYVADNWYSEFIEKSVRSTRISAPFGINAMSARHRMYSLIPPCQVGIMLFGFYYTPSAGGHRLECSVSTPAQVAGS